MDRDSGVVGGNQLLDALPAGERRRLTPLLRTVFVDIRTVLSEPDATIESVHFPLNCVVSLVTPLQGGAVVEVATVGNDGIVGVPMVFGGALPVRAICSVAGRAQRMDTCSFLEAIERGGHLRELVADYSQALFGQISRAAACNRLHSADQRLSRWLLTGHDNVGSDEFAITHEYLARMLGSRRATVTLSAETLQAAGLISYGRGRVTIVDRAGLEAVACECYRAIETELEGVVQRTLRRAAASDPRAS